MKNRLIQLVQSLGHDVEDFGPDSTESVDYPDFAARVASSVAGGDVQRGVLICGTGIGMCIAANKFDGDGDAPTRPLDFRSKRPRPRPQPLWRYPSLPWRHPRLP